MQGQASYPCAVGRGGLRLDKREGDGATPIGEWPLRELLYRADRATAEPSCALSTRIIEQDDGWCDDPGDPLYNRRVKLPYAGRHERLWREDGLYDLIVVLGYNDDPPLAGRGSAIFLHVAAPDLAPTEGCVALAKGDLLTVLARLAPGSLLRVEAP
jgi:L,D-peptidoglycan transpeptidase YkuD (ErfK/YbiS/YcfS/YnhG family)